MGSIIFILFILSIPVFYILGLVKFIEIITGRDKQKIASAPQPAETHTVITDTSLQIPTIREVTSATSQPTPMQQDVSVLWQNWYANNSISLLLYIGAFLIVTAASIFVGFQWETISGVTKAFLLTTVALAFFICGMWFYTLPKIRSAGATFIAIGSLLIPVCGGAWYNFVLKAMDVPASLVWLFTSVISLFVYLFLATKLKSALYVYIASLATLSTALSVVNVSDLPSDYYILASITTAFLLLIMQTLVRTQVKELVFLYGTPLEISSNILMPISLFYGLTVATTTGRLFSLEAVLSLAIATGFYYSSFYLKRAPWKLAATLILLPITMVLFLKWQQQSTLVVMYMLYACSFLYTLLAYTLRHKRTKQEMDIYMVLIPSIATLACIYAFTVGVESTHIVTFTTFSAVLGIILAKIRKHIGFVGMTTIFLAIGTVIFHFQVAQLSHVPYLLGLSFMLYGIVFYGFCLLYRTATNAKEVFGTSIVFYCILALLFCIGRPEYLLLVAIVIAALFLHAAWTFVAEKLVYCSNVFLYFALFVGLQWMHIESWFYPLYFICFSFLLYGLSFLPRNPWQEVYSNSSLVGALGTSIIFGMTSRGYTYGTDPKLLETFALFSAYATTFLFGLVAMQKNTSSLGYIASAIGMVTYLWQISFLSITESLLYTVPLGVYFLVLGQLRARKNDTSSKDTLTVIGLLILIAYPVMLSFGPEQLKYSVAVGIEGIVLLAIGISLAEKPYQYAGVIALVLAILPQTYSYILALPRWLVVGLLGFVFLVVAIYLLLRRKEE